MNTFNITLDLNKSKVMTPIRLRQGDLDGTTITALILDHGATADLTGLAARFVMELPGGEHYYRKDATVGEGSVTVTINEEQAASVTGRTTRAYFQLLDGETVRASTGSVTVDVLPDALEGHTVPADYDSAIQDAIDALDDAVENIADTVEDVLEDHPEWTTTVQDGAVTDAKLAQTGGVLSCVDAMAEVDTTFVDGVIANSNGSLQPATSDGCKTSDYIEVLYGTTLDITVTFPSVHYRSCHIYGYDSKKAYVGRLHYVEGNVFASYNATVQVANANVRYVRFTFSSFGDTYNCKVRASDNVRLNIIDVKESVRTAPYGCLNQRDLIGWQLGDIDTSGNVVASTKRIVISDIVSRPYDILLPLDVEALYMMWTYDDEYGTNPTYLGYITMWNYAIYRLPYVIPANTYFRLVVRSQDEPTITETDVRDTALYKSVQMYERNSYATIAKTLRNGNVMSIAHQGMGTNPDNRGESKMSALVKAHDFGFSHIETDVQWSSDNVPMCCHDLSFTDTNTSDSILISEHTAQELKTYGYFGETILTLEEVVAFCKQNGMGLVIDRMFNFSASQWEIAFGIVTKYAMQDDVIWLVMSNNNTAEYPNQWYANAHIAVLSNTSDLTADIAYARSIKTATNHVYIDVNADQMTESAVQSSIATLGPDVKLIMWTIDRVDYLEKYKPYIAGLTSNIINLALV